MATSCGLWNRLMDWTGLWTGLWNTNALPTYIPRTALRGGRGRNGMVRYCNMQIDIDVNLQHITKLYLGFRESQIWLCENGCGLMDFGTEKGEGKKEGRRKGIVF